MSWSKYAGVVLFTAAATVVLPGCSTGDDSSNDGNSNSNTSGGGSGGTTSGNGPSGSIAKLNLISSDTTLSSAAIDDTNGVTITALARDDSNNAVSSPNVSFSASEGRLVDPKSNSNGTSSVTLYNAPDRANRDITVTATAGDQNDTITVPVVGTSIAVNGPSSVRAGQNASYTATLTDSAGKPISGIATDITPADAVVPAQGVMDTNNNGVVDFGIQTQKVGSIDVAVAADGATSRQTLVVTSNNLSFVEPDDDVATKTAGDPLELTVERVDDNGRPVEGAQIEFQTSRGTLVAAGQKTSGNQQSDGTSTVDLKTGSNGRASVTLYAANAGSTVVEASSTDSIKAAQQVRIVASKPTTLLESANPSTVAANASSTITSTVLDTYGNPVSGATVDFNIPNGSAGRLSKTTVATDANGQAKTIYTAPSNSTVSDTRIASAVSLANTMLTRQTTIRVAGQAIGITLGSSNQLMLTNQGSTYQLPFTVLVTDAAGNPVTNGNVTLRLQYDAYQSSDMDSPTCRNEDTNHNGVLENGEDKNNNQRLDPGQVASVPGTVALDDNGAAQFAVTYLSQYASRVKVTLIATASVAGSEGSQQTQFVLRGEATNPSPFTDECSTTGN